MNSDQIYNLLETISATNSKLAKYALLRENDCINLRNVLSAAYNPLVSYGLKEKTLPQPEGTCGKGHFDTATFKLVEQLSARVVTGHHATRAVSNEMAGLTSESAELLRRILLKDLRAGFSESTINDVFKGLLPEFPYMRCSLPKHVKLETWDWDNGVFSQEKADGSYLSLDRRGDGMIFMRTRQGTPYDIEQFPGIVSDAEDLGLGTQTHGELLVIRDGVVLPREVSNGLLNSVLKGGSFELKDIPIFLVWDQIPLECAVPGGKYGASYQQRLTTLEVQLGGEYIRMIDTRVVPSMDQALDHYREMLADGKEGTILKHPGGLWRDHTSKHQVKLKLEADCELKVVGFEPGKGKNAVTFGSLICESSDAELIVNVSGIADKKRKEIHENRLAWLGKIVTVRGNSIMYSKKEGKPHSLFLPRLIEERNDKAAADSFERIVAQYENAIHG